MDAALRRALLVPTIVTLAAMSVLLGLGTWQWQRKAWKEQVIATITARSKAAPIEAGDWLKRDCPNLDQFGIEHDLFRRWRGESTSLPNDVGEVSVQRTEGSETQEL